MRAGPIVTALMILGGGALAWDWIKTPLPPPSPQAGKRGEGRRAARPDTAPVAVASVSQATVPVYRDGIGTVQALNSVVVRAQVDGRLMSVGFTEGQMVRKGDVLARIDPTTFQAQHDQMLAKKAQSEATLANARNDLERYQRLAQSNAGPKQQADQQAAMVAQLEAQVRADDAALANARAVLAYATVVSPIDGRVGLRQVDPGNIVKPGDANGLVSIIQTAPIGVIFTLPQRDLPITSAALASGPVKVEVMDPDSRGTLADGLLQTIDNQIDSATGTIKLKATFANSSGRLWSGQYVSARIVVETMADVHVIPAAALRRGPNGSFVYVIGADLKAEVRMVQVALQDQTRAVIAEGLRVGERVVTLGFAQLSQGKSVEITDGVSPDQVKPDQAKPAGTSRRDSGSGKSG